ncbi:MAG: hypothetical protein QNJ45_06850 [Ardenticatenaceae bacterium]|nr:hypothetical protein [Ardenticatenaceae bacterium]
MNRREGLFYLAVLLALGALIALLPIFYTLPTSAVGMLGHGDRQSKKFTKPLIGPFAPITSRNLDAQPEIFNASTIAKFSKNGITILVKVAELNGQDATIALIIQADDRWPLNPASIHPPQFIYVGAKKMPSSSTIHSRWLDPETGFFSSYNTAVFEGVAVDEANVTAEIELLLHGLVLMEPLVIEFSDRKVGESWQPKKNFTVGHEQLTLAELRLIEQNDSEVEVELRFDSLEDEGIDMWCIDLWHDYHMSVKCQNSIDRIRAILQIDLSQPSQTVPYRIRANLRFHEPWTLTIPVEP